MSLHRFLVGDNEAGARLDRFLSGQMDGTSRSAIHRHILAGTVTVNGQRAKPSFLLQAGQVVEYRKPDPAPSHLQAQDIAIDIVYEDGDLVVVDKPAGMVVHPAAGHASGTLVNALLHHLPDIQGVGDERRPGIVHRIDKDTSGLLVVCKTERAHRGLSLQFKIHEIARCYLALVKGTPPESGTWDTPYGRHPRHRKKFTSRLEQSNRRAVTHFRRLAVLDGASLVVVRLETGRTHQVRVHFSERGHALVGDSVYGRGGGADGVRKVGQRLGRQALHAALLGFFHPVTGDWMLFVSDLPEDMAMAVEELGGTWPMDGWRDALVEYAGGRTGHSRRVREEP